MDKAPFLMWLAGRKCGVSMLKIYRKGYQRDRLEMNLSAQAWESNTVNSFEVASELLRSKPCDGVLVYGDTEFTTKDFIAHLRASGMGPSLVTLSVSNSSRSAVELLSIRTNEALTISCFSEKLIARIWYLLRRWCRALMAELKFSSLVIDKQNVKVCETGESVALAGQDLNRLSILVLNRGRTTTCESLLDRVGSASSSSQNQINVLICNLRKKVKERLHADGERVWLFLCKQMTPTV